MAAKSPKKSGTHFLAVTEETATQTGPTSSIDRWGLAKERDLIKSTLSLA